jgi:hypothetical protein
LAEVRIDAEAPPIVRTRAALDSRNAFAERFARSIKEECLECVVPLGEAHLQELVREYVRHYQHERPHQGLGERVHCAPASAWHTRRFADTVGSAACSTTTSGRRHDHPPCRGGFDVEFESINVDRRAVLSKTTSGDPRSERANQVLGQHAIPGPNAMRSAA